MAFYEPLRRALSAYARGVHEANGPAAAEDLSRAVARAGGSLPPAYADFLRSFDGVQLFHELIVLFGSTDAGLARVSEGQVRVGETPDGALWMDEAGHLRLVDEAEPDPILAGSTLERWLAATLAREGLVIDRDGEFREVVDEEGALDEEVRRKRARHGRRHDPEAALYLLEEAELLLGARQEDEAVARLEAAVALDPGAGPAWELLGALRRQTGPAAAAETAALAAAAATPSSWLRASRLLDAALAVPERRLLHAQAAWVADRDHAARLVSEAGEALGAGQLEEATGLLARLELLCLARPDGPDPLDEPLDGLRRALRARQALRVL